MKARVKKGEAVLKESPNGSEYLTPATFPSFLLTQVGLGLFTVLVRIPQNSRKKEGAALDIVLVASTGWHLRFLVASFCL
jgi:hypothetical protein